MPIPFGVDPALVDDAETIAAEVEPRTVDAEVEPRTIEVE